jgi:hypothetical protein
MVGAIDLNCPGGSGESPVPGKNWRILFLVVACIATLVLAAGTAASTGENFA